MKSYQRSENIVVRTDDQKVLVQQTGEVLQMDESGLFLLNCLTEPQSEDELLSKVGQNFSVESEEEKKEIKQWLEEFILSSLEAGLIRVHGAGNE